MFKWFRTSTLDPLGVSMAGAKLGDRLLIVGCGDPRLIAALAAKPGLTGHVSAIDESAERADAAGRHALAEGALVEPASAPLDGPLPYEAASFNLVVMRGVLLPRSAPQQAVLLGEAYRVLRPGGRCLAIESTQAQGLMAKVFGSKPSDEPSPAAADLTGAFKARGFAAARTLAERDGLAFIEGIKPGVTSRT